jgi:aldehyde dehydrogenase (NAD+)
VAVGEKIMRDGAETMKRVTLELGGKSPTILLDDAVLDQAANAGISHCPPENAATSRLVGGAEGI